MTGASKAEVLAGMRGRLRTAEVPRLVHFSVDEWRRGRGTVVRRIRTALAARRVAVRSSARDEDGPERSQAGRYRSILDVANDPADLAAAIDRVAATLAGNVENRVFVQEMASDVVASGVIVTDDPAAGGPYYVIEYDDSGRTDTVTAGLVLPRTAVVFRGTRLRDVRSRPVRRLLRATRELERAAAGAPLEVEFAVGRSGDIAVLQVRPLTTVHRRPGAVRRVAATLANVANVIAAANRPHPALAGARTILGQMPDWNPAELIGPHPSPLAASLFRALITDAVWQRARAAMGYRPVPGLPLMVLLAGRPYVDVRASFNSLLPAGLPLRVATALVDVWLNRLDAHPELHDKVELEVAQTAMDFSFATSAHARYAGFLRPCDLAMFTDALRGVTARAVVSTRRGTLAAALAVAERAPKAADGPRGPDPLRRAFRLLDACRRRGTLPFAVVARHAFIAEALLRSAVARGALTPDRLDDFRRSLVTVTRLFARDVAAAAAGRMTEGRVLARYGHLRPGSFDVTSPRYDSRPGLLSPVGAARRAIEPITPFVLRAAERAALHALLRECGLTVEADDLLRYAAAAIAGRERVKFLFTHPLSTALECLAEWGRERGLTREDIAHLTLSDMRQWRARSGELAAAELHRLVDERRAATADERSVRLSALIRGVGDLYVLPMLPTLPTFITARAVTARPLRLDGRTRSRIDRRIVCVEHADPGFDWIFTRPIAGLVTRFGGGNSHMAIRCNELALPAAIGVGEELFTRLERASLIELRCGERIARAM
jgi:glutamine kinase